MVSRINAFITNSGNLSTDLLERSYAAIQFKVSGKLCGVPPQEFPINTGLSFGVKRLKEKIVDPQKQPVEARVSRQPGYQPLGSGLGTGTFSMPELVLGLHPSRFRLTLFVGDR